MLLETNEPLTAPVKDIPVAQFPVVEHSSQNNTDLEFLDDLFLPEYNLTGVEEMSDLNSYQGNFFPDRNISDWSFENMRLDDILSQQNYQWPTVNNDPNSSYSVSQAICSETVQSQNVEVNSTLTENDSLMYDLDSLVNKEMISSSNDDPLVNEVDLQHDELSLISESDEVIEPGKDYTVAGKKYLQMRQKNNVASQRSRKLRKQKNIEMTERLKKLEVENTELTQLVKDMEKERDALQRLLLSVIAKK